MSGNRNVTQIYFDYIFSIYFIKTCLMFQNVYVVGWCSGCGHLWAIHTSSDGPGGRTGEDYPVKTSAVFIESPLCALGLILFF